MILSFLQNYNLVPLIRIKLKMMNLSLLNTNIVIILVTGLLHEEVSAPDNYYSDRPLTSTAPIGQVEQNDQPIFFDFLNVASQENKTQEDIPSTSSTPDDLIELSVPPYYEFTSYDRVKCKREISAIFDENLPPGDHVRHAIEKLTIKDNIGRYAHSYYNLFHVYLHQGNIPSISQFCNRLQMAGKYLHETYLYCVDSVTTIFKAETPKTCLLAACFYLTENTIKATENIYAIKYFSVILNNFGFKLKPKYPYHPDYKKPFNYCDSIIHLHNAELDLELSL